MNIKTIRKEKKITQKQLAEAVGLDHSSISKYESGKVMPPADKLQAIAQFLGVDSDKLLESSAIELISIPMRRRVEITSIEEDRYLLSSSVVLDSLSKYTNGCCELCGRPAPFISKDGRPFLEIHYLKWLSKGGSTDIDNVVVLCPNCHRKIHELNDENDLSKLYKAAKSHVLSN